MGGRLEYKLRAKIEQNEEEVKNGSDFGPMATDWMFSTLHAKHYEPSGRAIARVTTQLNELNKVIWEELGIGVRTPEGAWDWIGRKRRELQSLGGELTSREVSGYFRGDIIVKTHTLSNIIAHHCLSIDFTNKVGNGEAGTFHDVFALFLSKIAAFSDTEEPVVKFGLSDVYDSAKNKLGNYRQMATRIKRGVTLDAIMSVAGKFPRRGKEGKGRKESKGMRM